MLALERSVSDSPAAPEGGAIRGVDSDGQMEVLRNRIARELERQYPGITRLREDSNGFLILGR